MAVIHLVKHISGLAVSVMKTANSVALLLLCLCGCGNGRDGGAFETNLRLVREGRLAEEAFTHPQTGVNDLFPEWDKGEKIGADLSDIYYEAGHMALARRMAFETDVCKIDGHNPDMVKRLVQTNIIYGEWDVAEKYILWLEKDGKYRRWAASQRRFLRNDAAVESDPEYGPRRRCIPEKDFYSSYRGLSNDLWDIVQCNPDFKGSVDCLGVYYLLDCNVDYLRYMLEHMGDTSAISPLPRSFAEAACIISRFDRNFWNQQGVSPEMHRDFVRFCDALEGGKSVDEYKDTYWYYYFVIRGNI